MTTQISPASPPPPPTRSPADVLAEQSQALQQINANLTALNQQVRQMQPQGQAGRLVNVAVENINMPFLSMVVLMVKWALASIPAALILMLIWVLLTFCLVGVLGPIVGSTFGNIMQGLP